MKTINLTTTEGRIEAVRALNLECKNSFKREGIEICEDALFALSRVRLEISIKSPNMEERESLFASEVSIYCKSDIRDNFSISVGSSGNITPEDIGPFWRVIHTANILNNWNIACELVMYYCNKYSKLIEDIKEVNKNLTH